MSGGIGKKLHAQRKIVNPELLNKLSVQNATSAAPVKSAHEIMEERKLNGAVSIIGGTTGNNFDFYSSLAGDDDAQYEMLVALAQNEMPLILDVPRTPTDLWSMGTLNAFKRHEENEIEDTLFKNDLIEEGVHQCVHCGCRRIRVITNQTRSLDEGESQWHHCTKCNWEQRVA